MKRTFTTLSCIYTLSMAAGAQTILLSENFTNYAGTAATVPAGWNFTTNASYTSGGTVNSVSGPPAYKFDGTGITSQITTPSFTSPDSVSFWAKGVSTDSLSKLILLQSADTVTWDTLAIVAPIPTTGSSAKKTYKVSVNSKWLRFVYSKSAGNVAFDDLLLTGLEPIAAIFSTDTSVCLSETNTFTNLSYTLTGTIVSYNWDFGDTIGTSLAQSPTYTYTGPGIFNVRLIVTNSIGEKDTSVKTITVNVKPVASFTVSSPLCLGTNAQFTNTSTIVSGTISGKKWTFGDSTGASTVQNPNYKYDSAGTYYPSLVVTSDQGCTDSSSKTVTILPRPAIDTSGMVITPSSCTSATGSITGITANGIAPLTYVWLKGTTVVSSTANLTNASGGTYKFTVTDSNSCATSLTLLLGTTTPPPAPSASSNSPLCENDTLKLSCASITGATYNWTGPNGFTSSLQNPVIAGVTVANTGTYSVNVTISGCISQVTNVNVTVNKSPIADFVYTINQNTVTFTNKSNGATSYLWNFGNGDTSTLTDPVDTFLLPGTYIVKLTAFSDSLCKAEHTDTLYIVGINEINAESHLAVYPNPSPNGAFTIEIKNRNNNEAFSIAVYNVLGEKVYSNVVPASTTKHSLHLSGVPSGIYFLTVIWRERVVTKKIGIK